MVFEVTKQERETNQSLIRRFTKRLRESGMIKAIKKSAFSRREKSEHMKRRAALRRLEKRREYEHASKLGQK